MSTSVARSDDDQPDNVLPFPATTTGPTGPSGPSGPTGVRLPLPAVERRKRQQRIDFGGPTQHWRAVSERKLRRDVENPAQILDVRVRAAAYLFGLQHEDMLLHASFAPGALESLLNAQGGSLVKKTGEVRPVQERGLQLVIRRLVLVGDLYEDELIESSTQCLLVEQKHVQNGLHEPSKTFPCAFHDKRST